MSGIRPGEHHTTHLSGGMIAQHGSVPSFRLFGIVELVVIPVTISLSLSDTSFHSGASGAEPVTPQRELVVSELVRRPAALYDIDRCGGA